MSSTEKKLVAIDGTDALAYVILRPGADASGVVIEAGANGISKAYAAYALRHTAQSWDPNDSIGADVGEQLKAALADNAQLRTELEQARAERNCIAMALQFALVGDGWATAYELRKGVEDILATGPGADSTPACACAAELVHQAGCPAA
jgi:hypothetical protein